MTIPPLYHKPPTASAELCCTSGDTHSQKGTYNVSFIPTGLVSCTFQITIQDPVPQIQSTEWNGTTIYINDLFVTYLSVRLLRTPEKTHNNVHTERNISEFHLQNCGIIGFVAIKNTL